MNKRAIANPSEITDLIRYHEGHMILEAGAGTGKTYNLTERVIHQLIERRVPLERMLALTFTDFAAAEMRARIYAALNRRLREIVAGSEAPSRSRTSRDKAIKDQLKLKDHLNTARRRFSGNYISTIHSFCNRILRYYPDELTQLSVSNQPPSFPDQNYDRLETLHLEGSFELLGDYDEIVWMLEWRKKYYQLYKEHLGLQRQLSRLTVDVFESFMHRLSGVEENALNELSVMSPAAYLDKLQSLAVIWQHESEVLARALLKEFAAHPEWFRSPDRIPRSLDDLKAIKIIKGFSKMVFDVSVIGEEKWSGINQRGDLLFHYLRELEKIETYMSEPDITDRLSAYPDQEDFDPDHEAYWNMCDLAELGLRWCTLMRYQRFEAGFMNYDDMIWLTHRLFEENPEVVEQMRNRFDQILIDEFQDTDQRQWDIIRKLGFGIGHCDQVREKEILIVGDVKQAIYGFRGGDVAMMDRVQSDIKEMTAKPDSLELKIIPLPWSFRSNRVIIDFANRFFQDVFGEKEETASFEAHHQSLQTPSPGVSENADLEGDVRILWADCKQLKKDLKSPSVEVKALVENYKMLESRRIARFLREIHDGKHAGYQAITEKLKRGEKSVGMLYRRRADMFIMEQALREVDLAYTVAKGTSFYQRREIQDAWLLMSFLLDAFDDVSLVGLLRSPMISLSDSGLLAIRLIMDNRPYEYPYFWNALSDQTTWSSELLDDTDRFALKTGVRFLHNLRKRVPTQRVSELVEQAFFSESPYLAAVSVDSQVRENLIRLLDVIRKLECAGRGTLFEITGFLADRIRQGAGDAEAEQPDPAPIQLMTIHGAKGLQFPMVVLPDMYAGDHDGGVQLYIADNDRDSYVWPAIAYKPGNPEGDKDAEASFLYQVLKSEKQKRSLAETKRLFYVAITRAETHLLMSLVTAPSVRSKGSFASLLLPWLRIQQPGHVRIDELQVRQLEQLAKAYTLPREEAREKEVSVPPAGKTRRRMSKPLDVTEWPCGLQVPYRKSENFRKAERKVSVEIKSPSSIAQEEEMDPEEEMSSNNRMCQDEKINVKERHSCWKNLTPAGAGTLIHRTLETVGNPEIMLQTDIKKFWIRELMKMGYGDPYGIIEQNKEELAHHCQNALQWITNRFGDSATKRFEVAFELVMQDEDNKTITIRGSMDMMVRDRKGKDHVIDFKTGWYPETGSLPDQNVFLEHIRRRGYDRQIRIYRQACQEITGTNIPPDNVWLLFTSPKGGCAVTLRDLDQ